MTVLLNVRLLCTSPFSPSLCASQPPFLDNHPTPLHPQTAPTVRGEKKGGTPNTFKHVGINLTPWAPFSPRHPRTTPSSPDGLHPLYSSVRQCPRPHRNQGFSPLEHEKDWQIIRNPASPTESPAWALDTYAPAEVVGQRTKQFWTADTAKRRESVLGKCSCTDPDLTYNTVLCLHAHFRLIISTKKRYSQDRIIAQLWWRLYCLHAHWLDDQCPFFIFEKM